MIMAKKNVDVLALDPVEEPLAVDPTILTESPLEEIMAEEQSPYVTLYSLVDEPRYVKYAGDTIVVSPRASIPNVIRVNLELPLPSGIAIR
jgi:hypothetical protein